MNVGRADGPAGAGWTARDSPRRRMTRSRFHLALVAAAAVLLAGACDNATTPIVPTDPSNPIETTTVTFDGTLTVNGAQSFGFGTLSGPVTATLTSLGPDSTLSVGLALGTWSGSVCDVIISNNNAVQGTVLTGTAGTIGTLCVDIRDASGALTEPLPFVITVVHP